MSRPELEHEIQMVCQLQRVALSLLERLEGKVSVRIVNIVASLVDHLTDELEDLTLALDTLEQLEKVVA